MKEKIKTGLGFIWFYFSKVRDSINDGTNVYTVLKTKRGQSQRFLFLRYNAVWCAHGDKKLLSRQAFCLTISMRRGTPFQE